MLFNFFDHLTYFVVVVVVIDFVYISTHESALKGKGSLKIM